MLTTYTQLGYPKEALHLNQLLNLEGLKPNRSGLLSLLAACSQLEDLFQAKTTLLNMYGKCGDLDKARDILDEMKVTSVVSWNAMITAYAQHNRGREAVELLRRMDLEGMKPSKVTFVSVLDACASCGDVSQGRIVHERVIGSGFGTDVNVNNTLVSMYGKCGSLEEARKVFDEMRVRDIVSWNAAIVEYSRNGCGKEALELFQKMDLEGIKQDKISYSALLNACIDSRGDCSWLHRRALMSGIQVDGLINTYAKCGSLEDARRVFDGMMNKDLVSWNAMLTGYVQHKCNRNALKLSREMDLEGVRPDQVTFLLVLEACSAAVSSTEGKRVHARVVAEGMDSDDLVRNAIVSMYSECGNLDAARAEFEQMQTRRDVVCWTVMVAAYAQHGNCSESLKLFWRMQQEGTKPDEISFLCALFCCSHTGLVKDAMICFMSMIQDHGIEPLVEHFGCVIDVLGKAGWLEEAEELARRVPGEIPNVVNWRSLLGACKLHGDCKRGVRAFRRLDSEEEGVCVLLSNLHASSA